MIQLSTHQSFHFFFFMWTACGRQKPGQDTRRATRIRFESSWEKWPPKQLGPLGSASRIISPGRKETAWPRFIGSVHEGETCDLMESQYGIGCKSVRVSGFRFDVSLWFSAFYNGRWHFERATGSKNCKKLPGDTGSTRVASGASFSSWYH